MARKRENVNVGEFRERKDDRKKKESERDTKSEIKR